ncbi:MAG: STAS domain-containing protein [Bradymonadia bacterium]
MAIKTHYDPVTRVRTITIEKDFTFLILSQFQAAFRSGQPDDKFVIDFTQSSFIDSSGLGMLLMHREFAGGTDADITLAHPNEEILRVLRIANFDQLFNIVP